MSVAAVIVAGGMGKRLGEPIPKAFVPLQGKELFKYSFDLFDTLKLFSVIVVVIPAEAYDETEKKIASWNPQTPWKVVVGGAERWNSVKLGVEAAGEVERVMIHDAARPFVTEKVVRDLLQEQGTAPGIITATPVIDTVRHFEGSNCSTTVDRSSLIAVGTPQLFDRKILRDCFAVGTSLPTLPTDEAMLLQACNHTVLFSWGDRLNFKVTTPEDLILAEALLSSGAIHG